MKPKLSPLLRVSSVLLASGFLSTAYAASVTWGTATTMAGDTADVSTAGTKVFAYNWANATQTVNGVPFTAPGSGVTLASGSTNTGAFSSPSAAAFSAAYKAILPGAYINNGTPATGISVTLNNLVVGHTYQVQWWSEDSRSGMGTRNTILTSPGGNSITLLLNSSNSAGTPGQFSLGTFTADATTQVITATANVEAHLTALQLRDTTPPPLKAATGTDLSQSASWVAGQIPTASTPATWDSSSLGAGLTLSSPQAWGGINVSGALTDIDMTGSETLTLGTNGLSLSGVNMSIANPITLGGSETWTVAGSGKTFTASGAVARGSNLLTISGAGTSAFSGSLTGTGGLYMEGGNATYNATGGTSSDFRIGNSNTIANSFTMTGGDLTIITNPLYFAQSVASNGSLTQTGGTLTLSGLRAANQANAITTINLSGGTLISESDSFILNQRGTTTLTVTGTAIANIKNMALSGWALSGTTTVNLDGGTLSCNGFWERDSSGNRVSNGSYTSTVNFNGGLVVAKYITTEGGDFLRFVDNALVKEGGAKIDDGGFSVSLAKGLSHGGTVATDGGLTKSGDGTLTLLAANTYTGVTKVNQGTLLIGNGGSFLSSPSITVASGATLDAGAATLNLASGQTLTGSGALSGTLNSGPGSTVSPGTAGIGNLVVNGTLVLGGNTVMDVSKSVSAITNDQFTGDGVVNLGGTLTINMTGDALTVDDEIHIIANTGGASNDFSGVIMQPALPAGLSLDTSTLASDGTVRVVNRLSNPLFSPAGGSYVGAQSVTITSDSGTTIFFTTDGSDPSTSLTSGSSPLTINVPSNVHLYNIRAIAKKSGQPDSLISSATYNTVPTPTWLTNSNGSYWSNVSGDETNWQNDVIAGGVGVAADFSTLAMTQDITVTLDGSRVIGAMKFGDAGAVPQYNWEVASLGASVLTLDGGSNQPVVDVVNQTATISTILAGTQGLSKTGSGTLKFTAANTYTGATAVDSGTLIVDQSGSITAASGINVAASSHLQFTTNSAGRTVGNAISGTGEVLLSNVAAANGSNGADVTLSGGMSSFTGRLTADNIRISSAQNISGIAGFDIVINDGSQIFANDGGTANFGAKSITIAGRGFNASAGTGPLGALRLDNNHHYTGPVILAANAAIGSATFTGQAYVDGNISGNHELEIIPRYGNWNTKVYLSGDNTYGSTRLSGGSAAPYSGAIGELIANSATALSPGAVVVDGGRLTLNGYSFSIANLSSTAAGGTVQNGHATAASTLTVGTDGSSSVYGGTLANGAAASLSLTKTGAGTLTLTGPSVGGIPTSGSNFSGDITLNEGRLVGAAVSSGGNGVFGAANISRTITVNAGTTLELQAPNVFGGHGTANAATLVVNNATVTNSDPAATGRINNGLSNITLNNGVLTATVGNGISTIDPTNRPGEGYGCWGLNGIVTSTGSSTISSTATGMAGRVLLGSGVDTTMNVADGTLTVSAPLQAGDSANLGGLVKIGSGKLILSAANIYTTPTTIYDGTLVAANSSGSATGTGTVAVKSAAILTGTGSLGGLVTIEDGGIVAPGDSAIGTLTAASATLAGIYQCELGAANSDLLNVAGTLTVGATTNITFSGTPTAVSYVIASYGTLTGTLPAVTGLPAGYALLDDTAAKQIKLIKVGPGFTGWADLWSGLTDKTPGGDPDHDGISNLLEYILGGDPRVSSTEFLPKQSIDGSNLVITYHRRDASITDTTATGQWSADLSTWHDIAPVLVNDNGTDPDTMSITIPMSNAENGKLYGRVIVTQP